MSREEVEPGYTLPAFAKRYGLSVGKVRRAEKNKEIRAVTFAGLKRIPPAEAERLEKLLGLKPRYDEEAVNK
jgi:hypothetical protein